MNFNFQLTESKAKKIFAQIVSGLSYLHGEGFAHRDVKPENIFLDSENCVKLGDFGLSTT